MISAELKQTSWSAHIKDWAAELGFSDCRIARAEALEKEAKELESWLADSRHGDMSYMEDYFDLRTDPRRLVPGAKSVIVLAKNYFPSKKWPSNGPRISTYAYGKDYHKVIRKDLKKLLERMEKYFGSVEGRGFVDSAPVMEKAWAKRSGLGWMGKHTNIITKQRGSFYFLAVLITNIELAPDSPVANHCGECTACIDACPTDAIVDAYQLDASKCISYFTIELKAQSLPSAFKGSFGDWMFGCDICQDVCPWNRFSTPHSEERFEPKQELLDMKANDWFDLTKDKFDDLFQGSAVRRTKYTGLIRNINFLTATD